MKRIFEVTFMYTDFDFNDIISGAKEAEVQCVEVVAEDKTDAIKQVRAKFTPIEVLAVLCKAWMPFRKADGSVEKACR